MALVREGLSNPEIAARMGIGREGVKYHVSEILTKLGVNDREEAAAWRQEEARWWATAAAPAAFLSRKAGGLLPALGSVAPVAAMALLVVPLVVLSLIAFLLLRGGDNGGDAAPVALPANVGTLVYLVDDALWVAPLDGSSDPRAITAGGAGTKYGGYALRPDGGIDLYYLSQLEGSADLQEDVEVVVYRVALEGGEAEELFRFPTDDAGLSGVDVAPDGLRMVYADADALILRDLGSGEETVLARSRRILAGDGSYIRNFMLTSPSWSPTGERLYSGMFAGPDTVVSVIIDLPPRPVTVADIGYPGHWGNWSPDGSQLCLYSGDIYDGGLTLYNVETHEQIDVLALGVLPSRIEGRQSSVGRCAWSEDGRLAVTYTPIAEEPHRVFILNEQLALVDQSEMFTPSIGVIGWLSDGSGVVVARRNPDGESFSIGIYRPGGDIEFLPFEADAILAVIP